MNPTESRENKFQSCDKAMKMHHGNSVYDILHSWLAEDRTDSYQPLYTTNIPLGFIFVSYSQFVNESETSKQQLNTTRHFFMSAIFESNSKYNLPMRSIQISTTVNINFKVEVVKTTHILNSPEIPTIQLFVESITPEIILENVVKTHREIMTTMARYSSPESRGSACCMPPISMLKFINPQPSAHKLVIISTPLSFSG
jgi:hypothetical protein